MGSTIGVPESRRKDMEAFLQSEKIPLAVVSPEAGDVTFEESVERKECSRAVLYGGGWMRCPVALALAHELGMAPRDLGKTLDFLKIKIKECSLGCFK